MQKKLIAVAIAAALAPAAAMADTTVYGRIHTSIDSISGVAANAEKLSVNSSSSRFGVKGSEDLGGGLSAVYQLETGLTSVGGNGSAGDGNGTSPNSTLFSNARDTYIGLTGGFGTFLAGRLPLDNQFVYNSNLFADQIGDAANFTSTAGTGVGRVNGALHYVTPDMSGFNASLSYVPGASVSNTVDAVSPNTTADHGKNSYAFSLNYAANGITANLNQLNVQYVDGSAAVEAKPLSIAGSYDFGNGMVTAQYVKAKTNTAGAVVTDRKVYNIGGKFNVASNASIKAQYSQAGNNNSVTATGGKMWAIGYDYAMSKRTGVYVAYAAASNDSATDVFQMNGYGHGGQAAGAAATANGEDPKGFSVGLTHNF